MIQPSRKALRAGTPVPSTKVQLRTVTSVCCTVTSSEASAPVAPGCCRVTIDRMLMTPIMRTRAFEQPRATKPMAKPGSGA